METCLIVTCLIVTCLMITATTTKAAIHPQTLATSLRDDKLCMVDISGNQSTLICNHEPAFGKVLAGNQLANSADLLQKCPKSWIKRKTCRYITVEQPVPLSNQERLQNIVYRACDSFSNQVSDFFQSSLDDLVEDGISIGLPLLTVFSLYPKYPRILPIFLLLQIMNMVLSPVGDAAGDFIEYYQSGHYSSEGESEWSVRGIVSNTVEDHIKIVGYIITYHSTIIIQYLENTYGQPSQDATDGALTHTGARTALYVMKKGAFAYDTFQMAGQYSWINELSDAVSDTFTEMLFGQP
ncbi:hypothetical protein [Endozoicomonas montiporae]|nr:hypothetical protein [Endozoicomonas montiporae]